MSAAVLDQLADALAEEHRALLEHDARRLLHAGQLKLAALQALESAPPDTDIEAQRLSELAQTNRMNGALLTRRRREVDLTLRQLGQHDNGYDAQGLARKTAPQRVLAVA